MQVKWMIEKCNEGTYIEGSRDSERGGKLVVPQCVTRIVPPTTGREAKGSPMRLRSAFFAKTKHTRSKTLLSTIHLYSFDEGDYLF